MKQYYWNPRLEQVDAIPAAEDVYWASATNSPASAGLNIANGEYVQAVSYSSAPSVLASDIADSRTDTDGDGLPDWWEMQYFGNLGQNGNGDFDGDGLSNAAEYWLGMDPSVNEPGTTGLRRNYLYDRVDRLRQTTGNGAVSITPDVEGNILAVGP